jgi:hypothetical protein
VTTVSCRRSSSAGSVDLYRLPPGRVLDGSCNRCLQQIAVCICTTVRNVLPGLPLQGGTHPHQSLTGSAGLARKGLQACSFITICVPLYCSEWFPPTAVISMRCMAKPSQPSCWLGKLARLHLVTPPTTYKVIYKAPHAMSWLALSYKGTAGPCCCCCCCCCACSQCLPHISP